ncbi:MAG: ATP-binding cassette domain-containing protein [Candidatus Cloacimonetes bacterium]|nr:ATP-binding cassette domain-containing protein [Candidatus Cloacimonadota bacterium]
MPDEVRDMQLTVRDLTVAYTNGHVALHDAGFELRSGTICGLVGVNGSGKSTLFKSIMGFVKPVTGSVLIAGRPVKEALRNNWVAYVPQSEEVDWNFPVLVEDVVMMGRYGHMNFLRMPRAHDRRIALESLERVGMAEFRQRQIGELSGGQKKRVFLARALAQEGRIMLLDEPFTGVDVSTETAIIDLLRQLRADGHIILVSTHDLGAVPGFCDQVVIINRTVLAAGPTQETFTAENLGLAFGGALRSLRVDHTDTPGSKIHELRVITDDEGALVLREDGRLSRATREDSRDA